MSDPQEPQDDKELVDGDGNVWVKCDHDDCALCIDYTGKIRCARCEYDPPAINLDGESDCSKQSLTQ